MQAASGATFSAYLCMSGLMLLEPGDLVALHQMHDCLFVCINHFYSQYYLAKAPFSNCIVFFALYFLFICHESSPFCLRLISFLIATGWINTIIPFFSSNKFLSKKYSRKKFFAQTKLNKNNFTSHVWWALIEEITPSMNLKDAVLLHCYLVYTTVFCCWNSLVEC